MPIDLASILRRAASLAFVAACGKSETVTLQPTAPATRSDSRRKHLDLVQIIAHLKSCRVRLANRGNLGDLLILDLVEEVSRFEVTKKQHTATCTVTNEQHEPNTRIHTHNMKQYLIAKRVSLNTTAESDLVCQHVLFAPDDAHIGLCQKEVPPATSRQKLQPIAIQFSGFKVFASQAARRAMLG